MNAPVPYDDQTPEEREQWERETDTAVDWLQAVRRFGIARANEMFP